MSKHNRRISDLSLPGEDYSLPLIHDPDSAPGSSYPGLDEAPTQVKPHAALGFTTPAPEQSDTSSQLLGARLDHFELLDSIGVGGMGRVFRGRDTRLDRLVALKVLSPELSSDQEICRRFEQEAKAAARLDDRHFARVYFFGYDKGLRYIAMEYVEGENIRQKISRSGRLGVALVVNVGIQIARGLAHAAACGVVHRDIKPSNIILTPDGTAKLVDMGLARNFFQQSSPASELTQAGVTLGTFDYISPEQALDPREADVRSDIYSLGCTLYHALTGRPPFSKGSALQKILQHQNDAVPDPRRWVPDLPEPIVAILLKMLAKDPKERYQHPAELIEDLRAVASLLDIPLPDEHAEPSAVRVRQGFWERQLAWAAPLVVLAAGIALYAYFDNPTSPALERNQPTIDSDDAEPVAVQSVEVIGETPPIRTTPSVAVPRESRPQRTKRLVSPDADLWAEIQESPNRTTLCLVGNRYVLHGGSLADPLRDKDLKIEPASESGLVEIVVRADGWTSSSSNHANLWEVRGGGIDLVRLAFIVEPPTQTTQLPAIFRLAEGTLSMQECLVRLAGNSRQTPIAAIEVEAGPAKGRASVSLDRTVFLGADEILRSRSDGPVHFDLIDCAADQVSQFPLRLEGPGDVSLAMENCTIRSQSSTLIRAARMKGVRLQVRRCVFASRAENAADSPLVDFLADGSWPDSADCWWTGRENLYDGRERIVLHRGGRPIAIGFSEARNWGFDEDLSRVARPNESVFSSVEGGPLGMTADSGREAVGRLKLSKATLASAPAPIGVRRTPWGNLYSEASDTESVNAEPTSVRGASEVDKQKSAAGADGGALLLAPANPSLSQPGQFVQAPPQGEKPSAARTCAARPVGVAS